MPIRYLKVVDTATHEEHLIDTGGFPTTDTTPTQGSTNPVSSGGVYTELAGKQGALTFDSTPTAGSLNPVTSQGIFEEFSKILEDALADGAGAHNAIYRGKYLGTTVTAEQYTQISAGTFNDLFIGDYWTISGVNWRIAAFDYWLRCGDTECTTHHIVIVPDSSLDSQQMNDSNITTGGYAGSKMYTTNLATAKNTINNAFGSAHILNHRQRFSNAVTDGKASSWAWYDSTVDLMSESMVYGAPIVGAAKTDNGNFNIGIDKSQLPLFAMDISKVCTRDNWWLRGVVSDAMFASVGDGGFATNRKAGSALGVRPAFGIRA